ncbi:subtilisin-like protein [Colletotrichum sublineola]|nr:subtilisin-like protein [Colletotrichum sublineola]
MKKLGVFSAYHSSKSSTIHRVKDSISNDVPCFRNSSMHFRYLFDSAIFPGFSLEIEDTHHQDDYTYCIDSIDGVVKAWQPRTYLPASTISSVPDSASGLPLNASIFHGLTGVDDLHDVDITGRGLTIAMVDTGVDYLHSALGEGIGKGKKIRYGVDLVGDGWQVGRSPQPDADPYTECTEHGTHVSGIAAGNQSSTGFVGVAPDANLEHYRVAGCQRTPIQSDIVISAVLMAHSREVDILSLSLTLNSGPFPDEGKMIIVVALVVGSVNSTYSVQNRPRASFSVDHKTQQDLHPVEFTWAPATPGRFPDILSLEATTLNTSITDDAYSSLGSITRFSDTAVVLIQRSGCDFAVKMRNIKAVGTRYILIYNNAKQALFKFNNTFDRILGAGSVTADIGYELVRSLAMGPTGLGDNLPSLLAPGQSIWSTFPRSWGGYGTLSGTTARPLTFNDGSNKTYNFLTPVVQQGNGVVDALGAFFNGSTSLKVQNNGNESVVYRFSHRPAVTFLALSPDLQTITPWTRDNSSASASVQITADIKGLGDLSARCPLYSGFIHVDDGRNDAQLSISYTGMGCSMRQIAVMPQGWNKTFVTAATMKQAMGESYDAVPVAPNVTFQLQGHKTPTMYRNSSVVLPVLNVELAMYSQAFSAELLPAAASEEDNETTNFLAWSGQLGNGS